MGQPKMKLSFINNDEIVYFIAVSQALNAVIDCSSKGIGEFNLKEKVHIIWNMYTLNE